MKMAIMLKGGKIALLKAMGTEVKTGKYYNKAGKVALKIHGKNNYHFEYSKGSKSGHAEHGSYKNMTRGLTHQSEFQKQASKSKGKVVKIKAGTHAEKHRDKTGKVVTRHVSNKPKVKGTKQAAGSKVNNVKPSPKQTGKKEPVTPIRDTSNATMDVKGGKGNKPYNVKISGDRYFDGSTGKEISKKQHDAMVKQLQDKHKSDLDSAISGAQAITDKPGINGMKRSLTGDKPKKSKKIDSTSKRAKQLLKDREGKGVIGTPKK